MQCQNTEADALCPQVLVLLVNFVVQRDTQIAEMGVLLMQQAIKRCAPLLRRAHWDPAVQALSRAASPELDSQLFR